METATLAMSSDTGELDELLAAMKQHPQERHAMQQHAVLAFGRRTSAQPPLAVLLQDAMTLVGEVLDVSHGGVGELHGESLLLKVSALNKPTASPREYRCSPADVNSMAAFALRSGNAITSDDLRSETKYRDSFLSGLGLNCGLAVPLYVNGKSFGVLAVYGTAPRKFAMSDISFAETIAHLLSASAARIKAEEKLQEAREMRSSLLGMVDSMVMTLDPEGRVVDMNRACEELTKFQLKDIRNLPFWQAMVSPDDADLVRIIFESSRGSQVPSEFEGELIARDGSRRHVSWSLKVLCTGQVQTILVTGRDNTAQEEMRAELTRVKTLAAEATASLDQLSAKLGKKRGAEPTPQTALPPAPVAAKPAKAAAEVPVLPDDIDEALAASSGSEQRRSPRRAYRYRQNIAPMQDQQFPSQSHFFEVDFWDISACGFSFFMDEIPKFDTLMAALGRAPALSHFTARVMRVARMDQDDETRYLIGCDFIDRVNLPKTRI